LKNTLNVNGTSGAVDVGEQLIVRTKTELVAATGGSFFQALVEHLIEELCADCAAICKLVRPCSAVILAAEPKLDAAEYNLAGTPEAMLFHAGPFSHYQDVTHEFSGDARLAKMRAQSWSGVLLTGSSGEGLGVLWVVFRKPTGNVKAIEAALSQFAPRAAAEIEREQTEAALRLSESRYRELAQHGREGVWSIEFVPPIPMDLPEEEIMARAWEGRIEVANDAAARMLGQDSASPVPGCRLSEFKHRLSYVEAQFRELKRSGWRPGTLEFAVAGEDGSETWWERSLSPTVTDGKLVRVWGTARDISERKRQEMEMQKANTCLERTVADRTTQLEAANQELEAFSYSVSHDLRAAIQGILACSKIVVQDHGDKLGETGKVWLTHMAEDAAQLDKLTMALLDLSLVSRAGLCRSWVDLSSMAESIGQRLAASDPTRKAHFRIASGLVASADPALLRGVMDNLLGNAWKFTKTRETAEIEVGLDGEQCGEPVYFVRDNGVGFNMKYADKLFGAFQRLHRIEDFEGNGIGLATVRRVIHRHGGRVRAEAKVDCGATFFFTLGKPDHP
jgi:PAS domain S-box-containing protein